MGLFDHLIGVSEQRGRNGLIKCPKRRKRRMSENVAMGQSRHFGGVLVTSGVHPTPDMPLHRNN